VNDAERAEWIESLKGMSTEEIVEESQRNLTMLLDRLDALSNRLDMAEERLT
jgi:hypothetical protein